MYYPMEFEKKFLKGPPPWPPCFEKSGPPLLKKKLDPLLWAFGASPRMVPKAKSQHHKRGHEKLGQKMVSFLGFHFVRGHLGLLKDVEPEAKKAF